MTEYYKECLEKGSQYEDFIMEKLMDQIGIGLTSYKSREYNIKKGENRQGIEIKFDDKYKKTGNIYIEISEKTNKNNKEFIKSGIYRDDNSWLWVQGDYEQAFIFSKKYLILFHNSNKYKEVGNDTSRGFLIPQEDVKKYCLKHLFFKE
jgi:hypothetical protein